MALLTANATASAFACSVAASRASALRLFFAAIPQAKYLRPGLEVFEVSVLLKTSSSEPDSLFAYNTAAVISYPVAATRLLRAAQRQFVRDARQLRFVS